MTNSKKKRLSMLDGLAVASAPSPSGTSSMMSSNRALRSARDAVDAHHVWELDPVDIEDTRLADRLDPNDVADLRTSIEANGQSVPILIRRHPSESGRYLLVYGRRRLEAIRSSDKVQKVRALVANLDDSAAVRVQVSENTGRRDLSFIERALFARELVDSGFGNQAQVAEVLNATKSAISMALSVANTVGPRLANAIGPVHGVGRPRWEALAKDLVDSTLGAEDLVEVAQSARRNANTEALIEGDVDERSDASRLAFEAVAKALAKQRATKNKKGVKPVLRRLLVDGKRAGSVQRTTKGVRVDVESDDAAFSNWIEAEAQSILEELHERWQKRS